MTWCAGCERGLGSSPNSAIYQQVTLDKSCNLPGPQLTYLGNGMTGLLSGLVRSHLWSLQPRNVLSTLGAGLFPSFGKTLIRCPQCVGIWARLGRHKKQDTRGLADQGNRQTETQETSQLLEYRLWEGGVEVLQNQTWRGEWPEMRFCAHVVGGKSCTP